MEIRLINNAYAAGSFCRLPTEDGAASVHVLEGTWYEAQAKDAEGNDYTVYWSILPGWDSNDCDESCACDWDHPIAIIQHAPWRDVTAMVKIMW